MIFIDSNIPMYLIGSDRSFQLNAKLLVEQAIADEAKLVTDAEVFQEVLHRYLAIRRREAVGAAFELLHRMVDEVFPVAIQAVDRAREIAMSNDRLSARDAVHLAVMEHYDVDTIMSFDRGFDHWPGILRLG